MNKLIRKKNNKGFSLVELIVVVLIMAIIAVALAPQVMKWVNNSKVSTDVSNYDSLVANCQLALADTAALTAVKGATASYTIEYSDTSVASLKKDSTAVTSTDDLYKALDALDPDWSKLKAKVTGKTYKITIAKNGTVSRETAPDSTME